MRLNNSVNGGDNKSCNNCSKRDIPYFPNAYSFFGKKNLFSLAQTKFYLTFVFLFRLSQNKNTANL